MSRGKKEGDRVLPTLKRLEKERKEKQFTLFFLFR